MKPESKRPIEIEDLLRLKRAERPPAEFWSEFDRQLRAKQLAAIVARRPWWHRVPPLFSGFTRYHLPLGAAAVLAVTFITLREPRSGVLPGAQGETARERTVVVPAAADVHVSAARAEDAGVVDSALVEKVSASSGAEQVAAAVPLASEATSPGELSQMIPLLGAARGQPENDGGTASAEYLPASFAGSTPGEPVLARTLLATSTFDAPSQSRPAVEPLQQLTLPGDRARTKLLTAMVKPVAETRARTSDEIGSRLPEDRLYEQVRRFGARGAGLNIKL